MATLSDLGKKVNNTVSRQSSAFLRVWTGSAYEFKNMGRIMDASFNAEPITSEQDQDGRSSTQLWDITVSFVMMQASPEEISLLEELSVPTDETNYPNGHTIYFSGGKLLTSDLNSSLTSGVSGVDDDLPDYTVLGASGGVYDPNGILFQNVLPNPGAEINLDSEVGTIPMEFTGRLPLSALSGFDDETSEDANHIVISPE
jgi:hypothetical protein